jgi:hypothetical protein
MAGWLSNEELRRKWKGTVKPTRCDISDLAGGTEQTEEYL